MEAAARETILVVDDEPQVLIALEDLLSDDFLVLKSESAERALRLVEDEPDIAVVISDQRMPQMHGDELLTRLRTRIGAERILATGYADLTAVLRAVNEGQIFAYVTKPWDPEDLRMKIQRAADHFRLARQLEQERRLLEDLMRSMPDPIYFKDAELRFQRVNSALISVFDLARPDQLIGRRLSDVWPGLESVERAEAAERELLQQQGVSKDSIASFTVKGELRSFATTKAAICDRSGKPVGLVGIGRDVTAKLRMEESLRNREQQLRLTFLASSAGLFDWNLLTGMLEHSPSLAMMMLGAEDATLRGEEFESRVHPDDIARVRAAVGRHLSARTPLRGLELRAKVREEYRWFEVNAQAVWDDAGRPIRLVGSSNDISERKEQEARIRRLTRTYAVLSGVGSTILRVHQRQALLAEICNIAVHVGELALSVVASADAVVGSAMLASNGASADLHETIGRWLVDQSKRSGSLVERAVVTRRPAVTNDLRREDWGDRLGPALLADGHLALAVIPVLVAGNVNCLLALVADQVEFFDEDQLKLLAELADNVGFALEHSAQAQRLEFLAFNDELTGLANRRLLADRLTQQLVVCTESKLKLAVVIIDIERFRQINETLGRRSGDELLIEIARRLGTVSEGRCPIARYSSNTFAAIVGPLEAEAEVAQWLEQALTSLGQPAQVAGTELRLAARVGISIFPSDGQDVDVLLANAEAALKKSKESAHRYLFYTPAMNGRVAERLNLETRLRSGIEKQEFLLHYQPKVDLKTGRVIGLEALIRWLGPDGKLIPPGLFIPLLEETGMIVEVGEWVMRQAAWQYADWTARGLNPPRIAVNVSPLQLGQPNFVAGVDAILNSYPHSNSGLDLEITESVLMEDLAGNTEKLRLAKAAGLGVAIDDFGTGYSSLGYISRLPIDALKIDRSFVLGMTDDAQQMSIVTTIISLAHSLDLKVIAEGVETAAQAHLLRLLKCDQIQGYLVARPQAAPDAELLLANTFEFSRRLS
jgi:diguanylate cyclase (GGDEF)-like protein/PAS domain S-box-containing protein